ncbi:hypothetical protein [Prochlorococcus sp. MIT 1300]|uniref:hypothetical protein n=1 Tax=Prochlorococcus sp. MIT 1300 TaxID=3096218 RepID=UPI002A74BF4E|nr:hypothetical protein [Prochlorococcus sp. MIT 1300]
MRVHPIPPVTEPLQYRAIGIVRGIYQPEDSEQLTRGFLVDSKGEKVEAVVLGRVLTLMRRHLAIDKPHLWVVYPRCREESHLHLQIVGIWEPSSLYRADSQSAGVDPNLSISNDLTDTLPEGDDYFSIRGELIFTRPETRELVVKVRQKRRANGSRPIPFKLQIKGDLPLKNLRHFVSMDVRRIGQELHLEDCKVLEALQEKVGKRRGVAGKGSINKRQFNNKEKSSNS